MNIQEVLEDYKHNKSEYIISPKQINFIRSLVKDVYNSNDTFLMVSNLLERTINNWNDLESQEVKILIGKLMNRKPATDKQIKLIQSLYSMERINQKLKTEFTEYKQLNHWHIKRLLTTPSKFNLRPKDHPIHCEMDYEYGYQESTLCDQNKLYYLKFYDLMMLDYDNVTYNNLIDKLRPYKELMYFKIYETFNGFHVYVMSDLYPHNTNSSSCLMSQLGCDDYYVMFCYRNGYKIRLSRKLGRGETYIEKYIGSYGNQDLLNSECDRLIEIHDRILDQMDQ